MKSVLKLVVWALLAVILLLAGAGLLLPRRWRVERSVVINAETSTIHRFVTDLREWEHWENPNPRVLSYRYDGPPRGVGATRQASRGDEAARRLTITRADPKQGVFFESRLQGDEVTGQGSIAYRSLPTGTEVVWTDEGTLPLLYGPFLRDGVEKQLETHFDTALSKLKRLAEQSAAQPDGD